MKTKRDKTHKKPKSPKPPKEPDAKIELSVVKKFTLVKVLSQVAVAFIGGAADPITTKVILDYENAHAPISQSIDTRRFPSPMPEPYIVDPSSETDRGSSPLCEYSASIKMQDGTEVSYEFKGYDEQLCDGLAGEIIHTFADRQSSSNLEFGPTNPLDLSASPGSVEPVSSGDISTVYYGGPYLRGVHPMAANPSESMEPEIQALYADSELFDKLYEEWNKEKSDAEVPPKYSPLIQLGISPTDGPVYLKMDKDNVNEALNIIYPNIPMETQEVWAAILMDKLDSISSISVDRKVLPDNIAEGNAP
jgi:hypothetical protein